MGHFQQRENYRLGDRPPSGICCCCSWLSVAFLCLRAFIFPSIQLLRDVCNGELEGDTVGSTDVVFTPKAIGGGDFIADTETAGYVHSHVNQVLQESKDFVALL